MHFDILVEDRSGKCFLDGLMKAILKENEEGNEDTFRIHSYKGIGHIPKDLDPRAVDPGKRLLLAQLPKLLDGYGVTYAGYPDNYHAAVIVVCDLDDKCLKEFHAELLGILNSRKEKPDARFCIAIEEGEAWFLGDIPAIKKAYPQAKDAILRGYRNDLTCGTWELLANAIYPGGAANLKKNGYQAVGLEKSDWAGTITPYMDVDNNKSPSFCYFRDKITGLRGK